MNKNKIVLAGLCAVVITGSIYQLMPSSSHAEQATSNELMAAGAKESITDTVVSSSTDDLVLDNVLEVSAQVNDEEHNGAINAVGSSISNHTKVKVVRDKHQQPADHRSSHQPKPHGHENQRRNPEDNTLLPPGEPKKPLPNSTGQG